MTDNTRGAPFPNPDSQPEDSTWLELELLEEAVPQEPLVPGSLAYVMDEHGYGCDCDWCR